MAGLAVGFCVVSAYFGMRHPTDQMTSSSTVRYRWRMGSRTPTHTLVVAWLLCAVLSCLAIHSPHCDRCDGPLVAFSSSPTQASHQQTVPPDDCNGICWCCGFHALPHPLPTLVLMNKVVARTWPEPSSAVLAPRSSIFRPPRIALPV